MTFTSESTMPPEVSEIVVGVAFKNLPETGDPDVDARTRVVLAQACEAAYQHGLGAGSMRSNVYWATGPVQTAANDTGWSVNGVDAITPTRSEIADMARSIAQEEIARAAAGRKR